MKPKIIIGYRFPHHWFTRLEKDFELVFPTESTWQKEKLEDEIKSAYGMITIFTTPLAKEVFTKTTTLKIIANFGVGYSNIDVTEATKHGIMVTNTPDTVTEPTAELAFGLMINIARNISGCNTDIRKPNGIKWGVMQNLSTGLSGKRLGIIGMGAIGQAVARRANASCMEVVYHNRTRLAPEKEYKHNATYLPIKELMSTSDFISLHCPLTKETTHLIDTKSLKRMKPTAFIINTARGPVIDEKALASALKNGLIAGAALDVFENEPQIEPELLSCKNTLLLPHIGTATLDTRIAMANKVIDNILAFHRQDFDKMNLVNRELLE